MPAQVAILSRKILVSASALSWVSEPMYWGGFQKAELYLELHGLIGVSADASISFEGATQPGENATWTTIPVGAIADPGVSSAAGVAKYVREDLYPYVRVKVQLNGTDIVAELSVGGQLFEEV